DFQNFIGIVGRFDKHGLDTFKIDSPDPEISGYLPDLVDFGRTYPTICPGDPEQKMQQLQAHLITGTLMEMGRDAFGGDFPFFNHLVKSPKNGIGPFLAVSPHKILAYIIHFGLGNGPIGLDNNGTKGKQIQLKIGRGHGLSGHIPKNGTAPALTGRLEVIHKTTNEKPNKGPRQSKYKISQNCG